MIMIDQLAKPPADLQIDPEVIVSLNISIQKLNFFIKKRTCNSLNVTHLQAKPPPEKPVVPKSPGLCVANSSHPAAPRSKLRAKEVGVPWMGKPFLGL